MVTLHNLFPSINNRLRTYITKATWITVNAFPLRSGSEGYKTYVSFRIILETSEHRFSSKHLSFIFIWFRLLTDERNNNWIFVTSHCGMSTFQYVTLIHFRFQSIFRSTTMKSWHLSYLKKILLNRSGKITIPLAQSIKSHVMICTIIS